MGFQQPGFQGGGLQRPAWQRPQGVGWTPPWLARAQLWRQAQLQASLAGLDALRSVLAKEVGDTTGGTAPYDTSTPPPPPPPTTIAPAVAPSPPNGSTGVSVSTPVSATFSAPMDPTTISPNFTLQAADGSQVAGIVTYDAQSYTATFSNANLLPGVTYTARLEAAVADVTGNPLGAPLTWSFTTAPAAVPAPAPTVPTITMRIPASGAATVATNTAVTVTFSDAMNPNSITGGIISGTLGGTFTVTDPAGILVPGRVDYDPSTKTATFTPVVALAAGTTYTVRLDSAIQSAAGASLPPTTWMFTTAAAPAPTGPPIVTGMTPQNGATNVPTSTATVTATFSAAMDSNSITPGTFTLTPAGGPSVGGSIAYDPATNTASLTLSPPAALAPGTTYTVQLDSAIRDASSPTGRNLASDYIWTFTTAGAASTSGSGTAATTTPPSSNTTTASGSGTAATTTPPSSSTTAPVPATPNHEILFEIFDEFTKNEFTDEGFPLLKPLNDRLMARGEPRVDSTTREVLYNDYVRRRIHEGERFASPGEGVRFTPPDEVIIEAFEKIKSSDLTKAGYPRDSALTKVLADLGYEGVETDRYHPLWDQYQEKS
jgi:hypothetical protein